MGLLLNWFEVAVLLGAIAIVAFAVVRYRRSTGLPMREHVEKAASGVDPDDSRAEYLAALRRASREIAGDLEAREASTRALLREADERIATLTELLARSELVALDYQRSAQEQQSSRPQSAPRFSLEQSKGERRGEGAPDGDRSGRSGIHDSIRLLAQEGKRPEEIAKQLGVGTGEVVLVLGLAHRT